MGERLVLDRGITAASLGADRRRTELRADLLAVAADPTGGLDPDRFCGRPAILRRVGALLAEALPADVEHLVTEGLCGMAVTAAVALHTGIPFAALPAGAGTGPGDLHRGERVWAVMPVIIGDESKDLMLRAVAAGGHVAGLLAVADLSKGTAAHGLADCGFALHALFAFEAGEDAIR